MIYNNEVFNVVLPSEQILVLPYLLEDRHPSKCTFPRSMEVIAVVVTSGHELDVSISHCSIEETCYQANFQNIYRENFTRKLDGNLGIYFDVK